MIRALRSYTKRASTSALAARGSSGSVQRQYDGEGSITAAQSPRKLAAGSSHSLNSQLKLSTSQKPTFEIVIAQDSEHFKKIALDAKGPVVIDFYAGWCGPCKILTPRLEKNMQQNGKGTPLIKVDIDNEEIEDMVMRFGVAAVPTVIGLKDGKTVAKFSGVQDDDELQAFLGKIAA